MIEIYSNGEEILYESSIFPGGEVHVKINECYYISSESVSIFAFLKSSNDIFKLLLITDAVKRKGAQDVYLHIPYLPYARQDRVCNEGESLSLKVMCDLINSQNYKEVKISNVHSDVALALLNNSHSSELRDGIPSSCLKDCVLVSPDAGAIKKTSKVAEKSGLKFVRADKKRNNSQWEAVVYSDHIGDKNFLIVDDICDGGRTFVELAKKLRPLTDGEVNLYVTHGIFSKGMQPFSGLIDKIYCAYPWKYEDIFENEGFFDVNMGVL